MERVWSGRDGPVTANELHFILRNEFEYSENTLVRKGRPRVDWTPDYYGYPGFRVAGIRIRLHIAVWLYHSPTLEKGVWVDHKDRDPLNNAIENLRLVTPSQNNINRTLPVDGYKGVSLTKQGTWRARLQKDKKVYWGGVHATARDAAVAYNKLATEHFGECSVLNNIEGN